MYCLVAIVSKLNEFGHFLADDSLGVKLVCCLYELAHWSVLLNIGLTCLVRIVCLVNVGFVEESVGENWLRGFVMAATVLGGIGAISADVISGDVVSGVPFNLLTRGQTVAGLPFKV